jgi:uncharacterized protein (TIGR02996 family)
MRREVSAGPLRARRVELVAWDTDGPSGAVGTPCPSRGGGSHLWHRYQVTAQGEAEPRPGWVTLRRGPGGGRPPGPFYTASCNVDGASWDDRFTGDVLADCTSWVGAEQFLCARFGLTLPPPKPARSFLMGQVVLSLRGMTAWSFQCTLIDKWLWPGRAGRGPTINHRLSRFLLDHRRGGNEEGEGAMASGHYVLPVTFNNLDLILHMAGELDYHSKWSKDNNLRTTAFGGHAARAVWACGLGTPGDAADAEKSFVTTLLKKPKDRAGWSAYADFLMEHGDPSREYRGRLISRWLELEP